MNSANAASATSNGHWDAVWAYAIFRVTLAVALLFHSATRWGHVGQFAGKTVAQFAATPLPSWSVRWYAIGITFLEPAIGLLLLLGLRTRMAVVAAGLLVISLVFGTALRGDFTVLSEQLVYSLAFFFLLLYREANNRWSVDALLKVK